jgi:NAD(P)H-hydrate epimerase
VAVAALDLLGGAYGRRVALVCGRGNNGADGRVAAAVLAARGVRVSLHPPDADGLPAVDLVVDAAFGTGFRGTYRPPRPTAGTPVLAVDVPSGVDGDTGEACGTPLAAARTVTFVAYKPGLLQGDGRALAGRVDVVDLGLPVGPWTVAVVDDDDVGALVPPRPVQGSKWSSAVLVVAGSPGMTGAPALAARAAYRAGAGMVRLGVPGAPLGDLPASEAVGVALPTGGWATAALEAAHRCGAVVVGPGLGRDPGTAAEVRRLVAESPVPVVVDADGLVALAPLAGRSAASAPVVLTPHDGEYRTLLGVPPGDDRIAAARRLAATAGAVALVKGPSTAVADPDGRVRLALAGTTALSTAGTGDVLSGVIGAFLARGTPPLEAAAVAAHVHGRAGASGPGEGLVAGDLPGLVAAVLARAGGDRRG